MMIDMYVKCTIELYWCRYRNYLHKYFFLNWNILKPIFSKIRELFQKSVNFFRRWRSLKLFKIYVEKYNGDCPLTGCGIGGVCQPLELANISLACFLIYLKEDWKDKICWYIKLDDVDVNVGTCKISSSNKKICR